MGTIALLARDLQRQAQNCGGITLPSKLRHDNIANVSSRALEIFIERVPDRRAPHDSASDKCEEKGLGNVLRRWKVDALLLLREYLEVTPKGHPFGVAMQEDGTSGEVAR